MEFDEHPTKAVPILVSDVQTFGGPDRDYFTFVVLSIVAGFFGIDHVYLRSFPTAIAKTLVNVFTLGLWYFWDLLQIFSDSERIKKEGLNSPFDWIKGIGRGVFAKPGEARAPPKDYVIYTLLTFLGCLGVDKFYLGEYGQGIVKLISCFNIFLFLFGWFWVAWDWYHAVYTMGSVMKDGITTPLPYSMLFGTINTKKLFTVQPNEPPSKPFSFVDWMFSFLPSFPSLSFLPGFSMIQEFIDIVMKPVQAGATLAKSIAKDGETIVSGTVQTVKDIANPATIAQLVPQLPQLPQLPKMPQLPQLPKMPQLQQKGGGREEGSGLGPVVAGSIAALLLAGGAKGFYDFIRKQI